MSIHYWLYHNWLYHRFANGWGEGICTYEAACFPTLYIPPHNCVSTHQTSSNVVDLSFWTARSLIREKSMKIQCGKCPHSAEYGESNITTNTAVWGIFSTLIFILQFHTKILAVSMSCTERVSWGVVGQNLGLVVAHREFELFICFISAFAILNKTHWDSFSQFPNRLDFTRLTLNFKITLSVLRTK